MEDRKQERIPAPTQLGGAVEYAADMLTGLIRLSLTLGALPAWTIPLSLRRGISAAVHSTVQASAVVPHALLRGVNRFADEFSASGEEIDEHEGSEEGDPCL